MEEIPEPAMKKTLGKRAIPIQKIENKQNRRVSFSKRRAGLFKKASELSTLCGFEIAVIVFSEFGNAFTFCHPSAESVIQRYVLGSNSPNCPPQTSKDPAPAQSYCNGIGSSCNNEEAIQWENRIGRMGLNELKLYANYLQKIRDIVAMKAASMASPPSYVADQKQIAESDHGNQKSSNDDLLLQDNCFDDVKWGDIESDMANSAMVSPDCSDEYMHSGNGALNGGYLLSDVLPSSSSSCIEVDTEFDSSLCDIKWEEEHSFDLFASSLQRFAD